MTTEPDWANTSRWVQEPTTGEWFFYYAGDDDGD